MLGRFAGRDRIFQLLVAALVIPGQIDMLPLFLMLRQLDLINTYWAVIIPAMGEHLLHLPGAPVRLVDPRHAARRRAHRRRRRVAHLLVAGAAQLPADPGDARFTFMGAWNDFLWPMIVLTDGNVYTLPGRAHQSGREHVQDTELMMAGAVLNVVLLFVALQQFYTADVMSGSLTE